MDGGLFEDRPSGLRNEAVNEELKKLAKEDEESSVGSVSAYYLHLAASLGSLYAVDFSLKLLFLQQGWAFPAPLAGMFVIIAALLAIEAASPSSIPHIETFFRPALEWIAKWLPLFYVPSLVTVGAAIQGMPGAALGKVLLLVCLGMPASLVFTAMLAVAIRTKFKTELMEMPKGKPASPITTWHYATWASITLASLALAVLVPSPDLAYPCSVAFLLGCTVGGFMLGVRFPEGVKKVLHPLITCGVSANAGIWLWGQVVGQDYWAVLQAYLTKGSGPMGAGDLLMSFLGVVILSFGFRVFQQRALMRRHAPEIFGSVIGSSTFSLFATAFAAKLIGLTPELGRAVVPRSVTVALALPIAQQLQAPLPITAVTVMLTGLIGANFVQLLLDKFNFKDPIARGLATAGSAHGLGTAALAAKEPEALPYCAVAYALIGICSTLLVSIPVVREALLAITG